MVILRTRNKITDFLMILAWASPFKVKSHCCLIIYALALQGVSTRGGRLPSSLLGESGVAVYVGAALCSESSMFRRSYVPKVLYSEGSMFRRFYVPKVLYSEGSKVLCSEGSIFRRIYVPNK